MSLPEMIKVCVDLSVKNSPDEKLLFCEFAALPRVGEKIQILDNTLQVLSVIHFPVLVLEKGKTINLPNDWSIVIKVIVV